jgi:dihydrolipoamide dehydrogenase
MVERDGDEIVVTLEDGKAIGGDRLLVAIGRKPLTEGLGLETVGLPGHGFIKVNDSMQVSKVPWLYAVGDVNGRALLTHAGKYQARIASDHILGDDAVARTDGPGSPRVIFTDPQVAAVGLTLDAAQEAGRSVEAIDLPTGSSAGASFYGRGAPGTTRFVVDTERRVIVGATFTGAEITDFLQAATIAVAGEVPLATLAHAFAPFPTRSEIWLKFLEAYEQRHGITLHANHVH